MKKRILFVDDEPQVLEGLRDSLRSRRHEWTMVFVEGGEAALEELAAERFDVVLSDMRMPGMSGAELLRVIRERHPETVRLVLSGHSEYERTIDAAAFAHQFLAKPCQPAELQAVIEYACRLQVLLSDVEAQATVAGLTALPAAPYAYRKLSEALSSPDATAGEIAAIVEADVALLAKVLQLVNSAFFGLGRSISSAREAVAYLGMAPLRALVLSVELIRTFEPARPVEGFSLERLELHSALVARTASRFVLSTKGAEHAFTAGLLHDIGKLVLATEQPDRLEALLAEAKATGRPLHAVEREVTGTTHAEIGAFLLGLWGLPTGIVEAVAAHHLPLEPTAGALGSRGAVAVANALVNEFDSTGEDCAAPADCESLALETVVEIERWRAIVHQERERSRA